MKAYFEGFQFCELISGKVAAPASPIAPPLESGAIVKKGGLGMPVVISVIFFLFFWVLSIVGEDIVKELVLRKSIVWLILNILKKFRLQAFAIMRL